MDRAMSLLYSAILGFCLGFFVGVIHDIHRDHRRLR